MSARPVIRISPEEYLRLDRSSEFKSEYFDGEMYAMSGGLLPHALIGAALVREFGLMLKKPCLAVGSDLRVGVSNSGPYFYPDLIVYCGEPQLSDGIKDTLLNPTLIAEVLSPSTEAFDRGKKFAAYRRIPSLRQYVLVSQTEPRVESYFLKDGAWVIDEYEGLDAVCRLQSVGCELPMARIYRDVSFE